MPVLKLADLLIGVGPDEVYRTTSIGPVLGIPSASDFEREITGFTVDSRKVKPGEAFFALKGETVDGTAYVPEALEKGCSVAVTQGPLDATLPRDRHILVTSDPGTALRKLASYWRDKHDVTVVGVTGSLGKTSVKEAIVQALAPLGPEHVLKTESNFNTEIGLPLELLRLSRKHTVAVLEMGMYEPGDIALLARIAKPQVGVVTNVQANHLERTGSIERTAQGKAELVHALPAGGLAVLNGDDKYARAMTSATRARSVMYGLGPGRDFTARGVRGHGASGFDAVLRHGSREVKVSCPTPGVHNAINLLPGAVVAHHLGVSWDEIGHTLSDFNLAGRSTFIPGLNGSTLLDDRYNASAPSVIADLTLLYEVPGRRLALLGDMYELGDQEEAQHRLVGQHCDRLDLLFLLGPRTGWIAESAIQAGLPADRIFKVRDNEQAIEAARETLSPGDIMLIKGSRGLHLEEVVEALSLDRSAGQ